MAQRDPQEIFYAMSLHWWSSTAGVSAQPHHTVELTRVLSCPLRKHYGSIPCHMAWLHSKSFRMWQNCMSPLVRQRYFLLPDKCSLSCGSPQCNDDIQWWATFISGTGLPWENSRRYLKKYASPGWLLKGGQLCGSQHMPTMKNAWARDRTTLLLQTRVIQDIGKSLQRTSIIPFKASAFEHGWTLLTEGSASKKDFNHKLDYVCNTSTFQKLKKPSVFPWQCTSLEEILGNEKNQCQVLQTSLTI